MKEIVHRCRVAALDQTAQVTTQRLTVRVREGIESLRFASLPTSPHQLGFGFSLCIVHCQRPRHKTPEKAVQFIYPGEQVEGFQVCPDPPNNRKSRKHCRNTIVPFGEGVGG